MYRAHQLNLKRDVAFKVLSVDILQDINENPEEFAKAAKRLQIEVQTMAQVRHPNVLQIYDFGFVSVKHNCVSEQIPYITMEYVPGNTFRYTMSEEGFGEEVELFAGWLERYFMPVLDGLEAIHDHDIVHRDIKPENILMDGDTPKITDFGLARSTRLKAVSNSWDVKGTMPYMAPEQFADFRKARIPVDVYSLGKVLFEAVSGRLDKKMIPFKSADIESSATTFFKTVGSIIRKATSENPHNRYQTVSELRLALHNALQTLQEENIAALSIGPTPTYIRWLWVGIIAVLIAVGGMTVYHLVENETYKQEGIADISLPGNIQSTLQEAGMFSSTMIAKDGREMALVTDADKNLAFYSDASLVTFHHYNEFLKEVRASLTVKNGVVKHDDDIWIYLGDGNAQADQIIYQNSRFQLRHTEWALKPVRRVTRLGASAYAQHYGKRLPTLVEWRAIEEQLISVTKNDSVLTGGGMMHAPMHSDSQLSSSNVPEQKGKTVNKEWLAKIKPDSSVRSLVVGWSGNGNNQKVVQRNSWEGFYDVGFRAVHNAVDD